MRTLAILLSALALLLAPQTTSAEDRKPNFVFFLVDDLGWTDLGCYGSSFYETPNVDKLAASGLKFTNAYAACQVCSPTRASIMTGRYPTRTGITDYIGAAQPERWNRKTKMLPAPYEMQLAHDETTIAELLKQNGYATFFAGKWHLGGEQYWPEHQGFDVNQGGIDRGGPYGGKKYFSPYGNPRLKDGPDGEHLPDRLATETVKFITEHQDEPFLAYLSFYSVHTPLMSREDLKQKYQQKKETLEHGEIWGQEGERKVRLVQEHAIYAGMVDAMDQAVGKVLNGIDQLGLTKDTVVIFMSDNGGLSTSEGHPTSNLPLRAGKGWIYEGGIREPMIVRWPGTTKAGTETSQYVSSVDFFPTMLQIAGIEVPKNLTIDGMSFAPVLEGKEIDRGAIYWHYPHYGNQGGSPTSAIREGDWKLIEFYEDGHLELYNIAEDIGEQNDLAAKKPDLAEKMHAKLKAWRKETGAKMPTHRKDA
ncbi:Arylsulfatase [Bremerella volcania]|uniref:Arylsulfatase n=1 Tax=Bremerella volcania TaxID=2527984 RepID=A0A518CB12_9BACT|nr:sulfatase [Bremerella volcania]QDU76423.1 Arylsulfatase [Bremerella volcania]